MPSMLDPAQTSLFPTPTSRTKMTVLLSTQELVSPSLEELARVDTDFLSVPLEVAMIMTFPMSPFHLHPSQSPPTVFALRLFLELLVPSRVSPTRTSPSQLSLPTELLSSKTTRTALLLAPQPPEFPSPTSPSQVLLVLSLAVLLTSTFSVVQEAVPAGLGLVLRSLEERPAPSVSTSPAELLVKSSKNEDYWPKLHKFLLRSLSHSCSPAWSWFLSFRLRPDLFFCLYS
ncbi:hypothetical protein PVAG01_02596 [Phlyctema vagabunda]|uniref:Uncharacterized protein n=1 Tax=Phlyctema vagabunda TaxID=108571 RepID=A0ABR4PR54_9HELO